MRATTSEEDAVSLNLPEPIEAYFASENAHDPSAIDTCFAVDAVVRDERAAIEGVTAIKAWRVETGAKYQHTVEPLSMSKGNGTIVVTVRVTGTFPGSPIELTHTFALRGDRIASLEIG
jgi:hypothetical protein